VPVVPEGARLDGPEPVDVAAAGRYRVLRDARDAVLGVSADFRVLS